MKNVLLIAMLCASSVAFAIGTKPYLTLTMAKKIADVCEAKAVAEDWREVNIAIYDDGGNLKLFRRQDGAFLHSIRIAQLKGQTSAGMPRSTRALGEINYSDPAHPLGIEHVPGLVVFPGGLPIMTAAGEQIGGVGVSGATADQDEACAAAGIEAISEMLQ
jgi:uncharacterized protein GlcG (DUF336 family)